MTLSLEPTTTSAPAPAPESLPYFRLSRLVPGWWRPLASLGLFVLFYLVLLVGLILAWLLLGFDPGTMDAEAIDMNDPVQAACLSLMLALFIPAGRLTVRLMGRRGTLDSVAGRFRWGLFARSLAMMTAPVLLPLVVAWTLNPVMPVLSGRTASMLAVALLIIPLQAAGEEYLFRGLLMQTVGHWLRAPVWGLLASLPLFVLGHNYDAWGLVSVGVFAVVATWLTWRTGGLEAAVALHAVNNVVAFALGSFGMADLNETSGTWLDAALSSMIPIGFAVIFGQWWRRTEAGTRYARSTTSVRSVQGSIQG
ncbi:MAG: CPBP family intramembrane metalloprotease [Micropruina sp.]|uniref:CPBP family intramembrane glutamic endopeptidase n=1 Tax=Micropruina sp. TaxID=2737536 RepID=UPI0039E53B7B